MRRREFITLLGGAAAAWPFDASGQQETSRLLGFLGTADNVDLKTAFELRLRELGWTVGRDVAIQYRWAAGDLARFPSLVDELVGLNPDALVAGNTQVALVMRRATASIPIVAPTLTDPVGFGLVASHARPGGNVTGILILDTLHEKQLGLAAEVFPGVNIGLLLNSAFQPHAIQRKAAERAAAALGIKLLPVEVRLPQELDAAFQSLARERLDGVFILGDPMFLSERVRIAELAIEARLPTMFGLKSHVDAGGLMSYGVDLRENFRRAADFVDKILKGTQPSDLPVEVPTKYNLVINLKTAKAISLPISESFLARADEVIE